MEIEEYIDGLKPYHKSKPIYELSYKDGCFSDSGCTYFLIYDKEDNYLVGNIIMKGEEIVGLEEGSFSENLHSNINKDKENYMFAFANRLFVMNKEMTEIIMFLEGCACCKVELDKTVKEGDKISIEDFLNLKII
jgi:hypothetical protein